MNPFRFYRATSDEAAIEAAANGAVFFAGSSTLVDLMRDHVEQPAALVDITARLAAGGVGTVPWRLQGAEQALVGQPNGDGPGVSRPTSQLKGRCRFRITPTKVELLRRTVFRALEQTGGSP